MTISPHLMSRRPPTLRHLLAAAALVSLIACGGSGEPDSRDDAGSSIQPVATASSARFTEITGEAGIDFVHNTGGFGEKWLPETMGAGVVMVDHDGDDDLDLLFLNGTRFEGQPGEATTQGFYRNEGGMRFTDVTAEVGLDLEAYCLGGAAGDVDNDGDADLYLSCLGRDYLFSNVGGRFEDSSTAAGLSEEYEFGASVALLDADRDGWLDVFVARYVTWVLSRRLTPLLPQPRRRYLRRPHRDRRRRGARRQVAGDRCDRHRRRRLARHRGRQRHPAQPALPKSRRRHLRGDRSPDRHGLLRNRCGAGWHGNRRG
jgi:hypothetical protein